ncbi:MAG: plastocyanin/azurin family copper-binding protein [Candidatus Nitrosocaldus sp.]
MKRRMLWIATVAVVVTITSLYLATYYLQAEIEEEDYTYRSITTNSLTSPTASYPPITHPNLNVFAVSDRASAAITIALQDNSIKDMVSRWLEYGAHVTVAGVQPVELSSNVKITAPHQNPVHHELVGLAIKPVLKPMLDNLREEVSSSNIYNSSRYGEVIIAVNWNAIDVHPYPISSAVDLARGEGRVYEAHQQITRVVVDIDARSIKDIMVDPERVMRHEVKPNMIYMEMNIFMPYTVSIRPNTLLSWHNYSNIPHNVVGVYRTEHGSMYIDSKDIGRGGVWQYLFTEEGVFEYHCTYHEDEGMRGKVIIQGN